MYGDGGKLAIETEELQAFPDEPEIHLREGW
jgi:hypothetical protein